MILKDLEVQFCIVLHFFLLTQLSVSYGLKKYIFRTALNNDFKGLRGLILHRSPLFSVDSIVNELLAEKIHLQSYSEKKILSTSNHFVLVVPSKSFSSNQNKPYIRVVFDECSSISRKVIRRLSVLSWDNRVKPGNLTINHNLMLIDHLEVTKTPQHNTAAAVSSGPFTDLSTIAKQFQKFLSLQPQTTYASSFVDQLPHSSLGMSYFGWVLNSGVSHHMSPDFSSFAYMSSSSSIHVMTADDTSIPLAGVAIVITPHLSLSNVYLIPNLTLNLVSVGQIYDYLVIFSPLFLLYA